MSEKKLNVRLQRCVLVSRLTLGRAARSRNSAKNLLCLHPDLFSQEQDLSKKSEAVHSLIIRRIKMAIDRKKMRQKQTGVTAIEFAIVLPIFLLLIFGIVEFGIALYDKAVITNASREGARVGIVLRNPKPTLTDIQNTVLNYCQSYLITFGTQNTPSVSVPSGLGGSFGTPLTVSVSYQYSGAGLGSIITALVGPITLNAITTMNNE